MISKLLLVGLLALTNVDLAFGDNHTSCQWFSAAKTCIATVDSPAGRNYTALVVQLGICAPNNDRESATGGCIEDFPGVCKATLLEGLPIEQTICLPVSAPASIPVLEAAKLQGLERCIGNTTPACDKIRTDAYTLLGCPLCAEAANEVTEIEVTCSEAATQAACQAALGAAAPKAANAPAPASGAAPMSTSTPAAAPAPAPAGAPAPTPAEEGAAGEGEATTATPGATVMEDAGSAVHAVSSGITTVVAMGVAGLLTLL